MEKASRSLDGWRDYFSSADSDIFDVIKHAIMVAASDYPHEFRLKREGITELLFTCQLAKCHGYSGRIRLDDSVGKSGGENYKCGMESGESNARDDPEYPREADVDRICDQNAEALSDEIDEDTRMIKEVLRIKRIIDDSEEKSDESLFDLLRQLQLMHLSLEILVDTEIGKSIYSLRKFGTKKIRHLARALIEEWKSLADAWISSAATMAGGEPAKGSTKASVAEEEEGLPSPPMDEGAFLAMPGSMELSKIFDGMDDDGNFRNDVEFIKSAKNHESTSKKEVQPCKPNRPPLLGRKTGPENTAIPKCSNNLHTPTKPIIRPPSGVNGSGQPKPPIGQLGSQKPKLLAQPKINAEVTVPPKSEKGTPQKKPISHPNEKSNCEDETSFRIKLEITKRKLQERYQAVEKAKRQRTIQVIEPSDLPNRTIYKGIKVGGPARTLSSRR